MGEQIGATRPRTARILRIIAGMGAVGVLTTVIAFLRYWLFESDQQRGELALGCITAVFAGAIWGLAVGAVLVWMILKKETRIAFRAIVIATLAAVLCAGAVCPPPLDVFLAAFAAAMTMIIVGIACRDVWRDGAAARCRSCGYDLRLISSAKCPECGSPTDRTQWQGKEYVAPPIVGRSNGLLIRLYPPAISRARVSGWTVALVLLMIVLACTVSQRSHFSEGRWARVAVGMPGSEVKRILGEPDHRLGAGKHAWVWTYYGWGGIFKEGDYGMRVVDGVVESMWFEHH